MPISLRRSVTVVYIESRTKIVLTKCAEPDEHSQKCIQCRNAFLSVDDKIAGEIDFIARKSLIDACGDLVLVVAVL